MEEVKEYNGFIVGKAYMCILNNRASLTVGKMYKVEGLCLYNKGKKHERLFISIKDNDGYSSDYSSERFMNIAEVRKHTINQIIN